MIHVTSVTGFLCDVELIFMSIPAACIREPLYDIMIKLALKVHLYEPARIEEGGEQFIM